MKRGRFQEPSKLAIKQNYPVGQGETFTLNLTLTDEAGNPVDLTGHTITFALREVDGSVIGDYVTVVDSAGTIAIKIEDEETATWTPGNKKYLLIHDQPDGDRRYMVYGNLTVKEAF